MAMSTGWQKAETQPPAAEQFVRVLLGRASEAEIEARYLNLARILTESQRAGAPAA
ncbi:MAG: hypothetical protein ACRDFX_10180 [Chloroflexota bacterium]